MKATDIFDSYINGQLKQMVSQIEEFGWYDFVAELEFTEYLSEKEKLDLLCKAIRIIKR